MSSLASLQSKYASLLDKNNELKSRSSLLGACKSYSGLQFELAKKVARITLLGKASSDSTVASVHVVRAWCWSLIPTGMTR
jgi:hypothetical protein